MGLLMLRELLRQGVEVDLYMPWYPFTEAPLEPTAGLRIIVRRSRWNWGKWYSSSKAGALFSGLASRTLSSLVLQLRLLREHRRNPYDAVYQLSVTELLLLGRAGRFAPPIVVHPCTHAAGELRWHRAEQDYALRSESRIVHFVMRALLVFRSRLQPHETDRADLVLGLSDRFNQHLHEDYGVPWEKLRTLRTPVDLAKFSLDGQEAPTAKRNLLFVSRISARKGVAEIVELSRRLDDLADSVRLLVIGGPTQWSNYTAHLADLNPRVAQYIGSLPSEELPALMRPAAMLLVPSPYEPGSIATAEALGCGLPVVLSEEVGNAEAVSGSHVRFHRAGDVDDLEAAVRSMLHELELHEVQLRQSARLNAEAAFAPAVIASELIEIIESLQPDAVARARAPRRAGQHSEAARRVGKRAARIGTVQCMGPVRRVD